VPVYRPDFKADRHRPDIYVIQLGFGLPRRRDTRYPRDGCSIEKNIPARPEFHSAWPMAFRRSADRLAHYRLDRDRIEERAPAPSREIRRETLDSPNASNL